MRGMRTGLLVETIYDAAADPDGWPRVMAEIGTIFRIGAETFYYLGYTDRAFTPRSEEHTSELQSLMRISYAVFCLKKKTYNKHRTYTKHTHKHTYRSHNT